MKVLHVITGLGIGGAEQQLRLMLRHLPVRSEVVTLTAPGAVARGIESDGVPVTHLGMAGNRDLGALPRLVRVVRQGRYDVVHTHLYRACVYGRIAARAAGVRAVVATEHSLGDSQIEGRPLSAGTRGLYLATERLGAATVAVSDSVARRLEAWGVRPSRIRVVPNGIERDRFGYDETARREARARLGLPEDAFVVGGVGRLAPGKRFDRLIRAVASVPDTRLLLVGDGERRAHLEAVARECGAADRVLLTGACEDPPAGAGGVGREATPVTVPCGPRRAAAAGAAGDGLVPVRAGVAAVGSPAVGVPGALGPVAGDSESYEAAGGRPDLPVPATDGGLPSLPALLSAMDVFVSTSPDEAFGLAIVEALAAGLPVLYVACPAVDDLPPDAAPGARRIGESVPELISALRGIREARLGRLPQPAAAHRYDIAHSARQLMSLYESLPAKRASS
ncbi:glycosyltransferase [Streptomyces sp. NPDC048629]|uniref:glycosyltransferase n=1 Tax=Streptomyces sp. NPDC048629 TaxID=3154824 RepID=UPI0034274E1D